jgi:hypothetical protein
VGGGGVPDAETGDVEGCGGDGGAGYGAAEVGLLHPAGGGAWVLLECGGGVRLGVGGRTVIAIFLDGVIGQLGIDTQLERGSCGEEGGSDLGVGCNDELFGAEITGVPAAAGGVGSLSEDVVCGEGVDADLILVSWE